MFRSMTLVPVACVAVVSGTAYSGESPRADAQAILNEDSVWRCHFTWEESGPPPATWAEPDFDAAAWTRWSIGRSKNPEYFAYGVGEWGALNAMVKLLCVRGTFTVRDPASANLKLALTYRGGVVVYVNGKEVARNHLPQEADLKTPAQKYLPEAFFLPDGKPYLSVGSQMSQFRDRIKVRIRQLPEVSIPASALKKGTNVLALEIHAAPMEPAVLERHSMNYYCLWNTCGPITLTLAGAGAEPNIARPTGLHIWNAGVMDRFTPGSWADPHESLRPVRIVAARNGAFCGQVVVGSDAPIKGLRAEMSGLMIVNGKAEIPASGVGVSYPRLQDGRDYGKFFDALDERPPEHAGLVQPVWLKVRVPADAVPGDYCGTLTVQVSGVGRQASGTGTGEPSPAPDPQPAIRNPQLPSVPVELRILPWALPDPRDYATTMALVQSPETVALKYKVPMWSDEHLKLMERSYQLLAEVGNEFVWIPLMAHGTYGNDETWVRWVKQPGGGYVRDFTAFDRYMDLVQKHLRPEVVCFYLWDRQAGGINKRPGFRGYEENEGVQVSVLDPATGKVAPSEKIKYSTPEGKEFWTATLKDIRDRMEKRELLKASMFGMITDWTWPGDEAKAVVNGVFPGAKWVAITHPRQEKADIGYNAAVYVSLFPPPQPWDAKRRTAWQTGRKSGAFPRWGGPATQNSLRLGSHTVLYRIYPEAAQLAGLGGLGHTGADFWQVIKPLTPEEFRAGGYSNKHTGSIQGRFPETDWNQLGLDDGTEEVLAPGPQGAISTARFENLREGVQECEARIAIEKAIVGGRLDAALARKLKDALDERQRILRTACVPKQPWSGQGGGFQWYAGTGSEGLAEKLFRCAAEAAAVSAKALTARAPK